MRFTAALAVAGALAIVSAAQAQSVTGTPYLSNVDPTFPTPSALYANWSSSAILSSQPTGLEVQSVGWGSGYYVIPGADVQYPLNPLDTVAQLTLTWNAPTAPDWVGVYFTLNDNAGNSGNLGGYGGSGNPGNPANWAWSGNVLTITSPLPAGQIAAIQAGTDAVYSFELGIDGSPLGATIYDVTFNSLTVSAVPEPSTMALAGLGALGLLIFRRRS